VRVGRCGATSVECAAASVNNAEAPVHRVDEVNSAQIDGNWAIVLENSYEEIAMTRDNVIKGAAVAHLRGNRIHGE
jgi:hypothetical protein